MWVMFKEYGAYNDLVEYRRALKQITRTYKAANKNLKKMGKFVTWKH